jgi:SH3 domain-containing protein
MIPTRLMICAAVTLLAAASAAAGPAYVTSTVNLRSGATTSSDIVAKIPGGSLVDAANCTDWCEVEWQGKKGFAIATALDRSGRVPGPRAATRRAAPAAAAAVPGAYVEDDDYVPVSPPAVYAVPGPYYGYRGYYGYGYRGYGYRGGYGYGYRRGYRRW